MVATTLFHSRRLSLTASLCLGTALLSLFGCVPSALQEKITEDVTVAAACSGESLDVLSKKTQSDQVLSEVVATYFGFDITDDGSGDASFQQSVADVETDLADIYGDLGKQGATGKAAAAKVAKVQADIKDVGKAVAELKKEVVDSAKTALKTHKIRLTKIDKELDFLTQDFESLVTAVAKDVRLGAAGIWADVKKFTTDQTDTVETLTRVGYGDSQKLKNLETHLGALAKSTNDMFETVNQTIMQTDAGNHINDPELHKALREYLVNLEAYEAARLVMLGFKRADIAINDKLSRIDGKGQVVLAIAEFTLVDPIVSKGTSDLFLDTIYPSHKEAPAGNGKSDDLKDNQGKDAIVQLGKDFPGAIQAGFLVAACEEIHRDPSPLPSLTVSAEDLMYPVYLGIIEAYLLQDQKEQPGATPSRTNPALNGDAGVKPTRFTDKPLAELRDDLRAATQRTAIKVAQGASTAQQQVMHFKGKISAREQAEETRTQQKALGTTPPTPAPGATPHAGIMMSNPASLNREWPIDWDAIRSDFKKEMTDKWKQP